MPHVLTSIVLPADHYVAIRSSHSQMFFKIDVLKNFAVFISGGYFLGMNSFCILIFSNDYFNGSCAATNIFHCFFCIPSTPGAVQFFLFIISVRSLIPWILNYFAFLLHIVHFFRPWHFWCSMLLFPYSSPKCNNIFHLWWFSCMIKRYHQRLCEYRFTGIKFVAWK